MKLKKIITLTTLSLTLSALHLATFTIQDISANENNVVINEMNPKIVNESDIIIDNDTAENTAEVIESKPEISNRMVNTIRYRKKNVKNTSEWSGYRRISNNLKTGSKGGSISSTTATTFKTDVSGNISGINVSLGGSKSSSKGYTLNVGANQNVYMGFRVRYAVESGIREKYDFTTGKVYERNSYKVRKPQYGEYALIRIR